MNDTIDSNESSPTIDKKSDTPKKTIDLFGELDDQLDNFFDPRAVSEFMSQKLD